MYQGSATVSQPSGGLLAARLDLRLPSRENALPLFARAPRLRLGLEFSAAVSGNLLVGCSLF
jgi:hypothetical protein